MSLLNVGIDLSSIVQKLALHMAWIVNAILSVDLILTFESLLIPFRIRFEQACVRPIVLVSCEVMPFCGVDVRSCSLSQKLNSGVFFVEVRLILK